MDASRALVFRPLVKENEALGTSLSRKRLFKKTALQKNGFLKKRLFKKTAF